MHVTYGIIIIVIIIERQVTTKCRAVVSFWNISHIYSAHCSCNSYWSHDLNLNLNLNLNIGNNNHHIKNLNHSDVECWKGIAFDSTALHCAALHYNVLYVLLCTFQHTAHALTLSLAYMSAPLSSSSLTTLRCPIMAAKRHGVRSL
jgi:hypothetical protein